MGKDFIDSYTLSHIIGGFIQEKMRFSFISASLLHFLFEMFENYYWVPIHKGRCVKLPFLPITDCKNQADSMPNIIGDQLGFMMGFLLGKCLKKYYLPKWTKILIIPLPLILSTIFTNIIGKNPKSEYKIN